MLGMGGEEAHSSLRLSGKVKTSQSRHLTSGEKALVGSVFGNEINLDDPLIFNKKQNPFHPKNTAIAPNGNVYFNPKGSAYSEDFSKEGIFTQAFFIHEMTHVWQYQHGVNVFRKAIFNRNYEYLPFDPQIPFGNYGVEQQGDIVRDYFIIRSGFSINDGNTRPNIQTYEKLIPFIK